MSRPAARTLAVLAVLGLAASASAETLNCTPIPSLPYTITTKGVYCLTGDLTSSITTGVALQINASNVILDMNSHKIAGQSAGTATFAVGIYANQRQNITIRNGTVRGYFIGIWLDDASPYNVSQGHVVEDVRADRNTYRGIQVHGRGCLVQSNQVLFTGGTTLLGANAEATGIYLTGSSHRVIDNDVVTVTKQGNKTAYGIRVTEGIDNLVVDNRISRVDDAIVFDLSGDGKYRDNLTTTVAVTAFIGGFDAGNNN